MSDPTAAPSARGSRDRCPCGSGRKYAMCCGAADAASQAPPASRLAPSIALPGLSGDLPVFGALSEAGRQPDAAERFQRALYPDPLAALRSPGNVANLRGRPASSQQAEAADRLRQHADRLMKAGKTAAAIAEFRQAAKLDPANAGLHLALGQAFLRGGQIEEAEASFMLAITLSDDSAEARLGLGVAIERQGRAFEAIAAFRRAVELAPGLAEGHRRLANLLDSRGFSSDAAEAFRRAAAAAPETAEGRRDDAMACVLDGDFERAETHLRQAVAVDPKSGLTHKLLGDVLATRGRFDDAIAAWDAALVVNPLQADAHLAAVQARKCADADRPRLGRMLSMLQARGLNDRQRMLLHFAIGKMFDDFREYRDAMRHFDAANSLRRRLDAKFDREGFSDQIDRLIRQFTPSFFAENAACGRDDETPILIVGMPRTGTTLIEQILASHPQIAAGGELPFWVNRGGAPGIMEATDLTADMAALLSSEYLSLLQRLGPGRARATDKLPFNFLRVGLIHLLLPRARIIHCRRHPIDTCLSIYGIYFRGMMEFAADKGDLAFAYRNYARLMDHWREALPRDCFLDVDYESLIANREQETRRLIDFAGLPWSDSCLAPERNERAVMTASVWQVRQPVYATSVERWRNYEPYLGPLAELARQ